MIVNTATRIQLLRILMDLPENTTPIDYVHITDYWNDCRQRAHWKRAYRDRSYDGELALGYTDTLNPYLKLYLFQNLNV